MLKPVDFLFFGQTVICPASLLVFIMHQIVSHPCYLSGLKIQLELQPRHEVFYQVLVAEFLSDNLIGEKFKTGKSQDECAFKQSFVHIGLQIPMDHRIEDIRLVGRVPVFCPEQVPQWDEVLVFEIRFP